MASAVAAVQIANDLKSGLPGLQEVASSRRYSVHPETIYTTTEDGWSLAIHHWRGQAALA